MPNCNLQPYKKTGFEQKNFQPQLVSIGDMIEPGRYFFHSAFKHGLNFEAKELVYSVSTPEIDPCPGGIILNDLVTHPEQLVVTSDTIILGKFAFRYSESDRYCSRMDFEGINSSDNIWQNMVCFEAILSQNAVPESLVYLMHPETISAHQGFSAALQRSFRDAVLKMRSDCVSGVITLKGLGIGLTPAGLDFIVGILWAIHLLENLRHINLSSLRELIYQNAWSGNVFANTALYNAYHGRFCFRAKRFLSAIMKGNREAVKLHGNHLLQIGHTSGADMAVGFVMTMRGGIFNEIGWIH